MELLDIVKTDGSKDKKASRTEVVMCNRRLGRVKVGTLRTRLSTRVETSYGVVDDTGGKGSLGTSVPFTLSPLRKRRTR